MSITLEDKNTHNFFFTKLLDLRRAENDSGKRARRVETYRKKKVQNVSDIIFFLIIDIDRD